MDSMNPLYRDVLGKWGVVILFLIFAGGAGCKLNLKQPMIQSPGGYPAAVNAVKSISDPPPPLAIPCRRAIA